MTEEQRDFDDEDARMSQPPGTSAHWAALEQRVTGLEHGIRDVVVAVRGLADKIDSRSVTPWGLIASFGLLAIAVLGAFGKLAYDPVKDTQVRQELMIERLADHVSDQNKDLRQIIVPRDEYEKTWTAAQRSIDQLASRADRLETRQRP